MTASLLALVGTDTGVGKTLVAESLLLGLRQLGIDAVGFKPVETGLSSIEDHDRSDGQRLARASRLPMDACLGQSFPLPAAPLVASRIAATPVSVPTLRQALSRLADEHACVIVEGAGGLLVPFAEGVLWADVLSEWTLPAVIVARLGLGTINHTLLTANELHRRHIPLLGVILNATTPATAESCQTERVLREFGGFVVFSTINHGPPPVAEIAERLLASSLGSWFTSRCRSG
jgi:dethiobiotin synthetase